MVTTEDCRPNLLNMLAVSSLLSYIPWIFLISYKKVGLNILLKKEYKKKRL